MSPFLQASVVATVALLAVSSAHAELRIGTGAAKALYEQFCAGCHGADMEGGSGSSLIDEVWKHGNRDKDIARVIRDGVTGTEMIAWRDTLNAEQIRSLVILIREQKHLAGSAERLAASAPKDGIHSVAGHRFTRESLFNGSAELWGMAFLPDGSLLITQKDGVLWHWQGGKGKQISGVPKVWLNGQGGLLDVIAHPAYAQNGWVYLSYSDKDGDSSGQKNAQGEQVGATAVIRGKLRDGALVEQQKIFEVPANLRRHRSHHFGSRFAFVGNYLFFGIGDAGFQDEAQDLSLPNGKIHRIHDDGRIPADNPFVGTANAFPSIWSYGNRNPQGLVADAVTGELWETEHGPRGGDEINLIEKGRNYGWPVTTYGMNYNGTPISNKTEAPGMEQPRHYWTPSIAVSNLEVYRGQPFANWQGQLLVSSLSAQELRLLKRDGGKITADQLLLKNVGRLRDVQTGPEGLIYLLVSDEGAKQWQLQRLRPAE